MERVTLAALLLLTGCVSHPPITRSEPLTVSYKRVDLPLSTNSGQYSFPVFIRTFDDGGKLGVCGLALEPGGALVTDIAYAIADDHHSQLILAGSPVSGLSFLRFHNLLTPDSARVANCIRTEQAWTRKYANPQIWASWPPVRVTR